MKKLDVLSVLIDWQFQAQYKTPRSILPSSVEGQPQQASGVQFLGDDTCPYLAPTRLDGIWGSLWCCFVLIELALAGGLSLANQAKLGKIQTIMNEYVSCLSCFRVGNNCPVRQCLSGQLLFYKQFNALSFQTPMNAFNSQQNAWSTQTNVSF